MKRMMPTAPSRSVNVAWDSFSSGSYVARPPGPYTSSYCSGLYRRYAPIGQYGLVAPTILTA